VGNTGVTKVGVVERGKLQRDEAPENQKDCRSKLFKVQGSIFRKGWLRRIRSSGNSILRSSRSESPR